MYQCRDWIQRWGGQLTVESESGRGTVVTMALPLASGTRRGVGADGGDRRASDLDPAVRKTRDAVEEHAA
jgi:hypothetical protein